MVTTALITHMKSDAGAPGSTTITALRRRDLISLVVLAALVRVTYLLAGLKSMDLSRLAMLASDSATYTALAEYFLTGQGDGIKHLLVAGPGYPAVLAGLGAVFGTGSWPPVLLNVVLGAMAPVAVYLLAELLLRDRTIALLSGLFVALSFTGLSMSTSILTDQPYYTLQAVGLVAFVKGWQTGRARWFVSAGLLSAVAVNIRAVGQLWPYAFFVLSLWYYLRVPAARERGRFLRSLWTPAIMLCLIAGWSMFNQARYGVFAFTSNGVRAAWAYTAASAVADHTPGGGFDSVRTAWWYEIYEPEDGSVPTEAQIYTQMKSRVLDVLKQHPGWMAETFFTTVWRNARASNHFAEDQVPQWKAFWVFLRRACHDQLNPLLLVMSLAALMILAWTRAWESLGILGVTYLYFTVLAGFSFWQGSRLHFPAEMAWSVLVSCALVWGWRRMLRRAPD